MGARWHYIITDTLGHIDFIKSTITGASQADATHIMVPADGKFTTANANLLEKTQIYKSMKKMDCDVASNGEEWIRFVSPDNADVNVLSSSLFELEIVNACLPMR